MISTPPCDGVFLNNILKIHKNPHGYFGEILILENEIYIFFCIGKFDCYEIDNYIINEIRAKRTALTIPKLGSHLTGPDMNGTRIEMSQVNL